jgi:hypothetical protein
MKTSQIAVLPNFFDRYIKLVEDVEVIDALKKYGANHFDREKLSSLGNNVYTEGKWTVKDILQHIIDSERVFSYRALRFARNDNTPLPGYDENLFAANAEASKRSVDDLLEEMTAVRNSTIKLFQSFNDEMLKKNGICFNQEISVLAIGFTITGHIIHHSNVIRERYYPLL